MGFNTILGFLIFLFILKLLYDLVKYFILLREHPEDKRKFPVLSALIFGGCILFYLVAFLVDYQSSSSPVPTRFIPPTATRRPITPTSGIPCALWSKITPNMKGKHICVYGKIVKVYTTNEAWTRITFTDSPNSFFLSSTIYTYSDESGANLSRGDCVSITGLIKLYENIPYIDIGETTLYDCASWVQ